MFDLSNLGPNPGATKKRKRLGRGPGSGHGKTAGRGHKGQKSRSGGAKPAWFEGGQLPLYRRLPKRGFKNPFRVEYQIVNLYQLEAKFDAGAVVDKATLESVRLIRDAEKPVKLLAKGELTKPMTIKVDAASKKAIEMVKKVGGTVELLTQKQEGEEQSEASVEVAAQ